MLRVGAGGKEGVSRRLRVDHAGKNAFSAALGGSAECKTSFRDCVRVILLFSGFPKFGVGSPSRGVGFEPLSEGCELGSQEGVSFIESMR